MFPTNLRALSVNSPLEYIPIANTDYKYQLQIPIARIDGRWKGCPPIDITVNRSAAGWWEGVEMTLPLHARHRPSPTIVHWKTTGQRR